MAISGPTMMKIVTGQSIQMRCGKNILTGSNGTVAMKEVMPRDAKPVNTKSTPIISLNRKRGKYGNTEFSMP